MCNVDSTIFDQHRASWDVRYRCRRRCLWGDRCRRRCGSDRGCGRRGWSRRRCRHAPHEHAGSGQGDDEAGDRGNPSWPDFVESGTTTRHGFRCRRSRLPRWWVLFRMIRTGAPRGRMLLAHPAESMGTATSAPWNVLTQSSTSRTPSGSPYAWSAAKATSSAWSTYPQGNSHTQRSMMNRCRYISRASRCSLRTSVIAHRGIRATYWANLTPSGSSTSTVDSLMCSRPPRSRRGLGAAQHSTVNRYRLTCCHGSASNRVSKKVARVYTRTGQFTSVRAVSDLRARMRPLPAATA